eukprot:GILI01028667.1.p1 GENE.GILI01028667.1~~GILI01028667.1.p1  ORF type:complete len:353 (+),score=120.98 GILI01028667.1:108-1166(+)
MESELGAEGRPLEDAAQAEAEEAEQEEEESKEDDEDAEAGKAGEAAEDKGAKSKGGQGGNKQHNNKKKKKEGSDDDDEDAPTVPLVSLPTFTYKVTAGHSHVCSQSPACCAPTCLPPMPSGALAPALSCEHGEAFTSITTNGAAVAQSIADFFGLSAEFPIEQMFARSRLAKKVFFTSRESKEVLVAKTRGLPLKVINAGVKAFERKEVANEGGVSCVHRLCQEGIGFVLPYLTKRLVRLSLPDMVFFLKAFHTNIAHFPTETAKESLSAMTNGSFVALLDHPGAHDLPVSIRAVAAQKHAGTVYLMVIKADIQTILKTIEPLGGSSAPVDSTPAEASEAASSASAPVVASE